LSAAGYTEANFSGATYRTQLGIPGLTGDHINSRDYQGWFIGTGDEYSLSHWLPGLFWKTEYRYSRFDSHDVPALFNTTGLPTGVSERTASMYRRSAPNWSIASIGAALLLHGTDTIKKNEKLRLKMATS
jgi:hypothetical protein